MIKPIEGVQRQRDLTGVVNAGLLLLALLFLYYIIFVSPDVKIKSPIPEHYTPQYLSVRAQERPAPTQTPSSECAEEKRVCLLTKFLTSKNSPLTAYAKLFVQLADEKGLDWTLMPAISGIESSFGKQTIEGSHNPFGLGGDNFMHFESWEDAIRFEAALLSKHYRWNIARGIQMKYCPDSDNCNREWPTVVSNFSEEILK